jgi:hypothetical protein
VISVNCVSCSTTAPPPDVKSEELFSPDSSPVVSSDTADGDAAPGRDTTTSATTSSTLAVAKSADSSKLNACASSLAFTDATPTLPDATGREQVYTSVDESVTDERLHVIESPASPTARSTPSLYAASAVSVPNEPFTSWTSTRTV